MIQNISMIGGDLRNIKLAELLKNDGLKISVFGIDEGSILKEDKIKKYSSIEELLYNENIIIMPVPFSKDNVYLNAPYSKKGIKINEAIKKIKDKTIITGAIKDEYSSILEKNNTKVIDLMKEEDLTILNTIPTAEGALQIAMEETKKTIFNSNVLVLGFGRVGKTVADRFKAIGAKVYCEARKEKDISWIKTFGYGFLSLDDLDNKICKFDIIINTIPSIIIRKEQIENIKKECLIIDLASAPGGIDKNAIENTNIKCITALGLPGKVAPITSAEFIKEKIYNILK